LCHVSEGDVWANPLFPRRHISQTMVVLANWIMTMYFGSEIQWHKRTWSYLGQQACDTRVYITITKGTCSQRDCFSLASLSTGSDSRAPDCPVQTPCGRRRHPYRRRRPAQPPFPPLFLSLSFPHHATTGSFFVCRHRPAATPSSPPRAAPVLPRRW
jgi:hypothetical protein